MKLYNDFEGRYTMYFLLKYLYFFIFLSKWLVNHLNRVIANKINYMLIYFIISLFFTINTELIGNQVENSV